MFFTWDYIIEGIAQGSVGTLTNLQIYRKCASLKLPQGGRANEGPLLHTSRQCLRDQPVLSETARRKVRNADLDVKPSSWSSQASDACAYDSPGQAKQSGVDPEPRELVCDLSDHSDHSDGS